MIAALVFHALLLTQSSAATEPDAARVEAIVLQAMREPRAAGLSVAVQRDDHLVYSKAHGLADLEFAVAPTRRPCSASAR